MARFLIVLLGHGLLLGACQSPASEPAAPGAAGASGGVPGSAGASSVAGTASPGTPGGGSVTDAGRSGGGGEASGGGTPPGPGGLGGVTSGGGPSSATPTFTTRVLAMDHVAEGADAGDIDGDEVVDLVAGPRWYKGPDFQLGGTLLANPSTFTRDQYSTFFLTFVDDVDADGRPDVLAIGDAGGGNGSGTPNAYWYKNPGPGQLMQAWKKTALYPGLVSNESPAYVDLLGDAKRELVFMTSRTAGYAQPSASADAPWTYTAVTPESFNTPYVHGLGVGDINGDGLADLVERTGFWLQSAGAAWERHAFSFGSAPPSNWGGAQMQVFDVDGDGDTDVVTSLAAHGYGLSWFERSGALDDITFEPHVILPATAADGNFSQAHALVAADINGDGLTDLVSGKRYYAHPSTNPDPGTNDPALLVWFELRREESGPRFIPHVIDEDSGAGCNFIARDLTGDGKVDIFTTNKRGTFLHVQD